MTDWKLGQYVRVWRNEGYEYGHIEMMEPDWAETEDGLDIQTEGMLGVDDGKEIYTTEKELEEG